MLGRSVRPVGGLDGARSWDINVSTHFLGPVSQEVPHLERACRGMDVDPRG